MDWFRLRPGNPSDSLPVVSESELKSSLTTEFVLIPATKTRGQGSDQILSDGFGLPSAKTIPVFVDTVLFYLCNKANQALIVHRARTLDQERPWSQERNR